MMCPNGCNRELTETDGHVFDGLDEKWKWCEICGFETPHEKIEPQPYVPVIFLSDVGI